MKVDERIEAIMKLSPNVRGAVYHRVPHTHKMRLQARIIFDYELLYLEKGTLHIRIEDKHHTLQPGDIVLFKPGREHEFISSDGDCWMPHVHFDAMYNEHFHDTPIHYKPLSECDARERMLVQDDVLGQKLDLPDIIRIEGHAEVLGLLQRLIHAYDRQEAEIALLAKMLVLNILYAVSKGLENPGNPQLLRHRKALEAAVDYITEHYNRTIRLDELAKSATLSVFHFSRLFKQKYGRSPHQFQMRRRIEKAKELLLYSQMSVSAIAEEVGYSNVYAFSKAFKQLEHISPGKYAHAHSGMQSH